MERVFANADPEKYREFIGKTLDEINSQVTPIKNIVLTEEFTTKCIIIEFDDPTFGNVIFPFSKTIDYYRIVNDPSYLFRCEFFQLNNGFDEEKIILGKLRPQVEKARIFADDFVSEFKHLNKLSLAEYDAIEDLSDYSFYKDGDDYGIELIYTNPLRPNIIFKFSQSMDISKVKTDEDYMFNCQFYLTQDAYGEYIRFGRPYITFDAEIPLL
ncbi:MAG: hypothetical protein U0T79_05345 [Ferruginibacter sp.]